MATARPCSYRGGRAKAAALLFAVLSPAACAAHRFPWPIQHRDRQCAHEHASVQTLNARYDRLRSPAWVRKISRPTRANLDFAAYHANVMLLEPPPENQNLTSVGAAAWRTYQPFAGVVDVDTFSASLCATPLTPSEMGRAMAFSPLVDFLAKWRGDLAAGLAEAREAIRSERWQAGGSAIVPLQAACELFLHDAGAGKGVELWVGIEFQPWLSLFSSLPDADGDGVAKLYGRLRQGLFSAELIAQLRREYENRVLAPTEITTWANELASYWYPSYNTDLVRPQETWPDASVEADVVGSLAGASFPRPSLILRGKPQGNALYNVFMIDGCCAEPVPAQSAASPTGKAARAVSPAPETTMATIQRELQAHGGSWERWAQQLAPFHDKVRAELKARDPRLKALIGRDGFLFYRASLEQMVGGDLQGQAVEKNPFSTIVTLKNLLAQRSIDFLFVPVPTKASVYPDKLQSGTHDLKGQLVNPYERKFLRELASAGVEVVDLLPMYLAQRSATPLTYLAQDTHWNSLGLEMAAELIAKRVRDYPWYATYRGQLVAYAQKEVVFAEAGDLPSRLAPKESAKYAPMRLTAHQVITPKNELYDDSPDGVVTILGDSFAGVFERTFCRNAGLSAHIARGIGMPVDLEMSYGGGPGMAAKFLKRDESDIQKKRLVIWVMAARDLYNYWDDWNVLEDNQ